MKYKVIIAAAVVLCAAVAVALFISSRSDDTSGGDKKNTSSQAYGAVNACELLTQQVADTVLGAGAEKGTAIPESSSDDISVTTCTYTWTPNGDGLASLQNLRSATVLVRAPRTSAGAATNGVPFNPMKAGAEAVPGYGDKAFWDPEFKQLNVLKKDTWFILSVDMGKANGGMTLDHTKPLADQIISAF